MNIKNNFFLDYFSKINDRVNLVDINKLLFLKKKIKTLSNKNKIILVGNGGSASIANHVAVDLIKIAKKKALTLNEPNLITCFANDYGYEMWVVKALESYISKGDILILISSSGKSKNILNASFYAREKNIYTVTFSGFDKNNPLSKNGNLNFWVNSKNYNFIEMTHHIWLLSVVDFFNRKKDL